LTDQRGAYIVAVLLDKNIDVTEAYRIACGVPPAGDVRRAYELSPAPHDAECL